MTIFYERILPVLFAVCIFLPVQAQAREIVQETPRSDQVVALVSQDYLRELDIKLAELYWRGTLSPDLFGIDAGEAAVLTPLVTDPLHPEVLGRLPDAHPEHRLQRYLVIAYPDADSAERAVVALSERPDIFESVGIDVLGSFSAVPGDTYYGTQYPLPLLNLPSAWDVVRGHAWVSVLDNGLQTTHGSLGVHPEFAFDSSLGFSYRPHFSWNEQDYSGYPPGYPAYGSFTGVRRADERIDWPFGIWDGLPIAWSGHGTHVTGIIAAPTRFPSVGTQMPNPPIRGTAGVCGSCSVTSHKVSRRVPSGSGARDLPLSRVAMAIRKAGYEGNQVINMSLGFYRPSSEYTCSTNTGTGAVCDSIVAAEGAVLVAATGNRNTSAVIDFPASQAEVIPPYVPSLADRAAVIPVGGIQPQSGAWERWTESDVLGSNRGAALDARGVVAPARDVVSTTYAHELWNPAARCGDATQGATYRGGYTALNSAVGYGTCTGTSMAAPHVSGIVALMRSVDPLMSATEIRNRLRDASRQPGGTIGSNTTYGAGLPHARWAVNAVLASTNRLTPLFNLRSHNSSYREDYFHTTNPQQAAAAILGRLLPKPTTTIPHFYFTYGQGVRYDGASYEYPMAGDTAMAEVWIFTTHVNPKSASTELVPLLRLSYSCEDVAPPASPHAYCSANPLKIGHFYTTSKAEALTRTGQGYRYEGIEGYVYPTTLSQPAGTVALRRAYDPGTHTHVLFPIDREAYYASWGYTSDVVTLGYVYRNVAPGNRPTY